MHRFLLLICVYALPGVAFSQVEAGGFSSTGKLLLVAEFFQGRNPSLSWKNNISAKDGYFILERNVDSGYQTLTTIKVDSRLNDYRVSDEKPLPGINRYRLRLVDATGKTSFSQVASVDFTSAAFCKFYPNPADDHVIIQAAGNVDIKISTLNGNTAISRSLTKGINPLDLTSLEKGVYIVTIIDAQSKSTIRSLLYKN